MSFYDYSDAEITGILIGSGFAIAIILCSGLCLILHVLKSSCKRRVGSSNGHTSKSSGLIKEQSQSVLRGDHPIAFVLPTVSMSETASEVSDLEGLTTGYSSSTSISRHSSLSYFPHLSQLSGPASTSPRALHHPYSPLAKDYEGPPTRNTYSSSIRSKRLAYHSLSKRYIRHRPQLQHHRSDEQNLFNQERDFYEYEGFHDPSSSYEDPSNSPKTRSKSELQRRPSPLFLKHHSMKKQQSKFRSSDSSNVSEEIHQVEVHSAERGSSQEISDNSPRNSQLSSIQMPCGVQVLGRIKFQVQVRRTHKRPLCTLQLSTLQLFELDQSSFPSNRMSIKMTVLPDYSEHRETLMGLVDSGCAEFQETVEWDNLKLEEDVVKLTVIVRGIQRRKVYGHALLQLRHLSDPLLSSTVDSTFQQEVELIIYSSVSDKLDELYSDFLDLSLSYTVEEGILNLGIIQAKLATISSMDSQASLYVKVTLFEGSNVIKAKKTRLISLLSRSDTIEFDETFSILFPQNYLQEVSCIISLCGKSKQGQKFVVGRTSIGGGRQCSSQGLDHWHLMTCTPGQVTERRHKLM